MTQKINKQTNNVLFVYFDLFMRFSVFCKQAILENLCSENLWNRLDSHGANSKQSEVCTCLRSVNNLVHQEKSKSRSSDAGYQLITLQYNRDT